MTITRDLDAATPRKSATGPWLLILGFGGGFALLVALLLGAQASPRSIETRLEAQPALTATIAAFRESYPANYASFLNRIESHFGAIDEFVCKNADYLDWDAFGFAMAEHIRHRNSPVVRAERKAQAERRCRRRAERATTLDTISLAA